MQVRLRVQNFASLRAIDFEIPAGVNVLVGPNGSGKSTLLDALDRLFNQEWLMQFSLGRLYTSLEYGAPKLPVGA